MTIINNRHNNEDLDPFDHKNMHLNHNDSQDQDNPNNSASLPSSASIDEEWRNQRDSYVALKRSGNLSSALQSVRNSIELFSRCLEPDDYRLTFIQYDLADYSMEYAREHGTGYHEAIQALEKIAPELEQLFSKESFMYAYSQFKLSLCYLYSGNVSHGDELFETAVTLLTKDVKDGDTDATLVSSCFRQYGDFLKDKRELSKSLHAYERGIAILQEADTIDRSAMNALQHLSEKVLSQLAGQWKQSSDEELQKIVSDPAQSVHSQCLASRLLMKRNYDDGNLEGAYYAAARSSGLFHRDAFVPTKEIPEFYTLYAKIVLEYAGVPSTDEHLRRLEDAYGTRMRERGEFTPDPHDFWYTIAEEYYSSQRYGIATEASQYLAKRSSELSGPYSLKAYYAHVLLTACLRHSGNPDSHEYAARKTATIAEHALTETTEDYIYSRLMASRICSTYSNLTEALKYADQAETALLRQSVRDYGLMLEVYENLALQRYSDANTAEAQEALDECKKILGQATIAPERRARIFLHDAMFKITEGDEEKAHTQLLEARALIDSHDLSETDTMIYYLSARTIQYSYDGSPDALDSAEDFAEQALRLSRQLYGANSIDTVGQLRDLARVLFQRAQLYNDHEVASSAREYLLQAIDLYKDVGLETHAHAGLLESTMEVLEFLNEKDEELYGELEQRRDSIRVMIDLKNDTWDDSDISDQE